MKRIIPFVVTAVLLSVPLSAESLDMPAPGAHKPRSGFWRASIGAVLAASAFDAHSSMHRFEANPLLRGTNGRFQMRGFAVKAAITSGAMGIQYLLLRKSSRGERAAAFVNFGMAGGLSVVAAKNYSNPK
ncbi:MAG: hypothetical protein R2729_07045 [Bryobacteraceae bacterium]